MIIYIRLTETVFPSKRIGILFSPFDERKTDEEEETHFLNKKEKGERKKKHTSSEGNVKSLHRKTFHLAK